MNIAPYLQPRPGFRFLGGLVALSLIMALIAQYGFDLAPCDLCIYQRYPAALAVLIWLLAEITARRRPLLPLFALACLTTAGIAGFHTGIEQGWWAGPSSCSGDDLNNAALSLEALKAQLMQTRLVRCDKPAIEIYGITMASANALFSFGLAMIALFIWKRHSPATTTESL